MKKALGLLMVMILLIGSSPVSQASGKEDATYSKQPNNLRYILIQSISAGLSIQNNTAYCCSMVSSSNRALTCNLSMALQRKENTSWVQVTNWTGSGIGSIALDKTCPVYPGNLYRVFITATVLDTNGTILERTTKASSTVTCP